MHSAYKLGFKAQQEIQISAIYFSANMERERQRNVQKCKATVPKPITKGTGIGEVWSIVRHQRSGAS